MGEGVKWEVRHSKAPESGGGGGLQYPGANQIELDRDWSRLGELMRCFKHFH